MRHSENNRWAPLAYPVLAVRARSHSPHIATIPSFGNEKGVNITYLPIIQLKKKNKEISLPPGAEMSQNVSEQGGGAGN